MFEFLIEIFGEFLLQIILEVLVEIGLYTIEGRKRPGPIVATIGYILWGAIVGGISLWVLPSLLVTSPAMRVVNLVVTPIFVGICMAVLGSWRRGRGQETLRIDKFTYGYVFALSCALVRFWCAK